MIFSETKVKGAYIIDIDRREDHRGFFARCWCQSEFEAHNLNPRLVQINLGVSLRRGTLRGMHFQIAPYADVKISRCTRGAIYDVVIDLRPESPTYKQWEGVELTADNHRMLYVPEDCAHGYMTLADNTELCYLTSQFYAPDHAKGIRYNDPAFEISWPIAVEVISDADQSWPDYKS